MWRVAALIDQRKHWEGGEKSMWNDIMAQIQLLFASFAKNEDGQTLVEYGLIIGLVAVAIIGGLGLLELGINGVFTAIITALNNA
jgi:pilus assembly protein Flp/PilA